MEPSSKVLGKLQVLVVDNISFVVAEKQQPNPEPDQEEKEKEEKNKDEEELEQY